MGRYVKDIKISGTPQQVYDALFQYLAAQGYQQTQYKGEDLIMKPDTFTTGPIFFKVTFYPGVMHLESWMKQALLPGCGYVGEIAPEDFRGWACKGPWKKCISDIEAMFSDAQAVAPARVLPAGGFCTACGSRLDAGAAFCSKCGRRV